MMLTGRLFAQTLNRLLTKIVNSFKVMLSRLEKLRFSCCTYARYMIGASGELTAARAVGISLDVHFSRCAYARGGAPHTY